MSMDLKKLWVDMQWAEAGCLSPLAVLQFWPLLRSIKSATSGVGVGVGMFLLGVDALGGVTQAPCLQGV